MLGSPDNGVPVLRTREARRRQLVVPMVVGALVSVLVLALAWNRGRESQVLGAGSTLAAPLVTSSANAYRSAFSADNPQRPDQTGGDWVLDGSGIGYEPVGSLGGVMRLADPEVDFAISDYPVSAKTLDEHGLGQFPVAIGSLALVHRVEVEGKQLRLDAPLVARIFRGEVTRWNDPAVAKLNPGLALPDQQIVPVHRGDGSGSTRAFSAWLSSGDATWKSEVGTGPQLEWPGGVGRAVEKSEGVVEAVREVPGAIGYVEPGQAREAGLSMAQLRNGAGGFVAPDRAGMAAALQGMSWDGEGQFTGLAPRADAKGAYPITVPVMAVLKREPQQEADARRALGYLRWLVDDYDAEARQMGFLPLPADGAAQVHEHIARTFTYAR
ncbi:phosphate ABC transporter substrate-binding protein PstS [Luteococcus sp.]|uniref:phosphate ABC transporter substrate-binding protein PstS n=1 Tax=Luteococcus sp. TaxID=1969402 RepID=UPI00373605A8